MKRLVLLQVMAVLILSFQRLQAQELKKGWYLGAEVGLSINYGNFTIEEGQDFLLPPLYSSDITDVTAGVNLGYIWNKNTIELSVQSLPSIVGYSLDLEGHQSSLSLMRSYVYIPLRYYRNLLSGSSSVRLDVGGGIGLAGLFEDTNDFLKITNSTSTDIDENGVSFTTRENVKEIILSRSAVTFEPDIKFGIQISKKWEANFWMRYVWSPTKVRGTDIVIQYENEPAMMGRVEKSLTSFLLGIGVRVDL